MGILMDWTRIYLRSLRWASYVTNISFYGFLRTNNLCVSWPRYWEAMHQHPDNASLGRDGAGQVMVQSRLLSIITNEHPP